MKRLFTFLIALLPLVASAYDFKYNGILYNVVSYTENTVEVDIKPDIWMDAYTGDVEIPSFVSYNGLKYTVIGLHDYAFNRCPYMTSIKLPNTLKYIGKEAFSECNQLFSITIPESVIQYGYNVFDIWMKEITVLNPTPVEVPYNAFVSAQINDCVLYVPYGSANAYRNANEWNKFNSIEEFGGPEEVDPSQKIQLLAEKDWRNCNETEINAGLQEGQSVTSSEEGLIISNPSLSDNIWYPMTIIYDGAYLYERSYIIRIIAKIPSEGPLRVEIGNWYEFVDYDINVKNNDEFQNIDIFIPLFPYLCNGDAHIMLCSGSIDGSIVVQKVQIFETLINDLQSNPFIYQDINYLIKGLGLVEVSSADENLTRVKIPNTFNYNGGYYSVTSIGEMAFNNCKSLEYISIPENIKSISSTSFSECQNLKTVKSLIVSPFDIDNNTFSDHTYESAELIVPNGSKKIYQSKTGWQRFKNISEREEVIEPVQKYNVQKAGTLKSLIPGEEIEMIEDLTITGEINGDDLKLIREMAGCNFIDERNFGAGGNEYGKLTSLDLSGATFVSGGGEYYIIKDYYDNYEGNNDRSFDYKDFDLPSGAFAGSRLTKIIMPENTLSIGDYAFVNCYNLSSITIPNNVISIGVAAFESCNITDIYIPSSVTTIGYASFASCGPISTINIPENVTSIGNWAFYNCQNLTSVYSYVKEPLELESDVFRNVSLWECLLYVPKGCVEKYKETPVWAAFKDILEIDESSVDTLQLDNASFNVYTISGYKIRSNVSSIDDLPKGVYIINGKKVVK